MMSNPRLRPCPLSSSRRLSLMARDIPKKSSTRPYKYTGTLAEPIYAPLIGANVADPSGCLKQFIIESAEVQQVAKLKALCEWHGIPWVSPNKWELLAIALAKAHVPGMLIDQDSKIEHRGRPKKW